MPVGELTESYPATCAIDHAAGAGKENNLNESHEFADLPMRFILFFDFGPVIANNL
jgi:hypothetical protein